MKSNHIYSIYSLEADITTIFEDTFNSSGDLLCVEVRGFYFGKPTEENTKQYYGKLKAVF